MTTGDVVYSLRFFTHQSAEPGFELGSTAGESSMLTARLHMLCVLYIVLLISICYCFMHNHALSPFPTCCVDYNSIVYMYNHDQPLFVYR